MNIDTVRAEIVSLHEFFVDWFSGSCAGDDRVFDERFRRRFADDFALIPPGGQYLDLDRLAAGLRGDYDINKDFRIAIRNVKLRRIAGPVVLATYEEWQRNAVNSTPPDNGRVATVQFLTTDARPSGLTWLHVHETWLPADIMAAGPYDF